MRKTYSPEFKAKLVMEVLRGERLLNEIASENHIHPNMLTRWKTDATNNFHILFENENAKIRKQVKDYEAQIEELYKQIGKLTAQYEWMKKNLESNFSREQRILMVDFNDNHFSVSLQTKMLSLNRSSLYYKPLPASNWDLQLNRLIDITYTKHPEFGYRRITAWLESYYGFQVDKKRFCSVCSRWAFRLFIPDKIPVSPIAITSSYIRENLMPHFNIPITFLAFRSISLTVCVLVNIK